MIHRGRVITHLMVNNALINAVSVCKIYGFYLQRVVAPEMQKLRALAKIHLMQQNTCSTRDLHKHNHTLNKNVVERALHGVGTCRFMIYPHSLNCVARLDRGELYFGIFHS